MKSFWIRAAEFVGLDLDDLQVERMERLGRWLGAEAATAGGIGPNEIPRIDQRHLADSILYSRFLGEAGTVWDLGTGSGLPGLPLSIVHPDREFVLIDRSGRRVDLVRRAVRILHLENCQVIQADFADMVGSVECVVSRASLPPARLKPIVESLITSSGRAVVGGSWVAAPAEPDWIVEEIPSAVLDRPVWFLIMRRP